MRLTLQGEEKLQAFLKSRPSRAMTALAGALLEEAETAMEKSKDGLVPVAPDGGTLRASGFVDPPERSGTKVWVELGYGGAAAAYALAVHEFPDGPIPPSWQGKTSLNWNVPGSGPKYLETPVLEANKGLGERVARKIKRRLERA